MNTMQILNDFYKYIGYNPGQTSFNLLSNDWAFHNAGKKIEDLLSGYDPTGVISVMFAREIFLEAVNNYRIKLYDYLTKQEVRDDVKRDEEMYRKLNDPEVLEIENEYMEQMNALVMQTTGRTMIGERDINAERKSFSDAVLKAVEDLKKCRIDIYKKAGPIGKIERFTTRILVFERMADCLLHIEKAPDALYFCYINQYSSADGYFSFLIKNNGNIISICDRIPENYIGQHERENMRNARWSEAHADGIFPYNYIFEYENRDHKGYATTYMIDDEKLEFMNLEPEVYQPILVAMILLCNKYVGKEIEGERLYLSTMMKEYYLEEHPGTELMVLKDSSIAVRHEEYSPELPLSEILDGSLNEKFKMNGVGNLWVKLYGDGFEPDYNAVLSVAKPEKLLADKEKKEFYTEFVGSKDMMDREVYRKIRMQLADHIRRKMEEEYDSFGGGDKAVQYWTERVKNRKEMLIDAFCLRQYYYENPDKAPKKEEDDDSSFNPSFVSNVSDICHRIKRNEGECPSGICLNDVVTYRGRYLESAYDDETKKKCSIFFKVTFNSWKDMEELIGETLPKIFTGWTSRGELGYNGNSILQSTDAVGDIKSPLYGGFYGERRPSNQKEYDKCNFDVWMGFSKAGWKKIYESWLLRNGLGFEIEKKKEERKKEREEERKKLNLPAAPYEPSDFIKRYDNVEELIKIEKELDSVFSGRRIGSIGGSGEGKRAASVFVSVVVKGNKEKIEKLLALGWYKGRKEKRSDGSFYITLSKDVPRK